MPVEFKQHVAENGLRIIAEVDQDAHSAAAGFFVRSGARDEDPALMGVSHFLEHMMFKGTQDLSADELNRRFDEIGARSNAYTTSEVTCFYAHTLPENLGAASELLARMLRPALREDDFEREKCVIQEEIAMYRDEPFWVLYESAMERHFRGHPLGHRVLGLPETVGAMSRDQMQAYFDSRYSADNTIVSLAGRLDFDAAVEQISSLCRGWKPTRIGRDRAAPPTGAGEFEMRQENITRAYIIGFSDAPALDDGRRYAAVLLSQVLGASDNSRLHWALIETGLAEEASAGYDPHDGCGSFYIYASGDPQRAEEIWSTALREIDGVVDSITDDDLLRLRNKLATGVTLGGERPADRMQRIGRLWTYLERHRTLEEELDQINRVTIDDIREVARSFTLRPSTIGRLLPA
jgi:predicted Zn-dependent peptidase